MNIIELKERESFSENIKTNRVYLKFKKLLKELIKKDLPSIIVESVNHDIEELNSTSFTDKNLRKLVYQKQTKILMLLKKELKIVPKNYYQNQWIALGMSAFGLPIGVVFGLSMGNWAFLGIGLPIGMAIGICLGMAMDKKAFAEGRQLDLTVEDLGVEY